MMKNLYRVLIAILIVTMVLPMAVSCAQTEDPAQTTAPSVGDTAATNDPSATTSEETLFAPSEIPADLRFDGETVKQRGKRI